MAKPRQPRWLPLVFPDLRTRISGAEKELEVLIKKITGREYPMVMVGFDITHVGGAVASAETLRSHSLVSNMTTWSVLPCWPSNACLTIRLPGLTKACLDVGGMQPGLSTCWKMALHYNPVFLLLFSWNCGDACHASARWLLSVVLLGPWLSVLLLKLCVLGWSLKGLLRFTTVLGSSVMPLPRLKLMLLSIPLLKP